MRAVAIVILALCCGGCAAGRQFDLVPRDPEAPWLEAQRWVRTESSRATINASYDHEWLDHLIFVVEVVNQSESTLVVDPQAFTFTLAASGKPLPYKLQRSFAASDPEAVVKRLDRAIARGAEVSATATALAGLVVVAAVVAAVALDIVDLGDLAGSEDGGTSEYSSLASTDTPEPRAAWLKRERAHLAVELLRCTTLAPGAKVRGEIWLPVAPLWKAIGGPTPEADHMSITGEPLPPPSDYQLTLHTPRALGGQEIEFSVAAW